MYTVVVLSMYGAMVMSNIIFAHGGCYVWQHGKNKNSATAWQMDLTYVFNFCQ